MPVGRGGHRAHLPGRLAPAARHAPGLAPVMPPELTGERPGAREPDSRGDARLRLIGIGQRPTVVRPGWLARAAVRRSACQAQASCADPRSYNRRLAG
jgi:hypothetical protein